MNSAVCPNFLLKFISNFFPRWRTLYFICVFRGIWMTETGVGPQVTGTCASMVQKTGNIGVQGTTILSVWWVRPGQQANTHSASLSHFSLKGPGENGRKVRRDVGWDDDSLTRKATRVNKSLLPISRWISSHFLENRASAHLMVTWEVKHHNQKCLPLLWFFLSFL